MALHQLDARTADNGRIEVELSWEDQEDAVYIAAYDAATGDRVFVQVPPEDARVAFWHPFSYAEDLIGFPRP